METGVRSGGGVTRGVTSEGAVIIVRVVIRGQGAESDSSSSVTSGQSCNMFAVSEKIERRNRQQPSEEFYIFQFSNLSTESILVSIFCFFNQPSGSLCPDSSSSPNTRNQLRLRWSG